MANLFPAGTLTGFEAQRGSLSLLQDLGETISQCLSVCPPQSMHVPICLCVCNHCCANAPARQQSIYEALQLVSSVWTLSRSLTLSLANKQGSLCPGQHPLASITPHPPVYPFAVFFSPSSLYTLAHILYMSIRTTQFLFSNSSTIFGVLKLFKWLRIIYVCIYCVCLFKIRQVFLWQILLWLFPYT